MPRPPLYHWKDSEIGRKGLCYILMYAQSKAGDKLLTSSPGEYGIGAEDMRKWVLEKLPELEAEHNQRTGTPLTGRKMMGRLYNMFDVLPDGSRVPSSEHPTRNDNLINLWNSMTGVQKNLFEVVR